MISVFLRPTALIPILNNRDVEPHPSNACINGRYLQRFDPSTEQVAWMSQTLPCMDPRFGCGLKKIFFLELFPWWQSKIKMSVSPAMTTVSLVADTETADWPIKKSASPAAWMVSHPASFYFSLSTLMKRCLFCLFRRKTSFFTVSVFTRSQCTATALVDRLFKRASSLTEGP